MVQGRDRIAEYWAAAAARSETGVRRVELSTLELQPLGDGAYEIGRATLTLAGGERATPKVPRSLATGGRRLRRLVDMWNLDTT